MLLALPPMAFASGFEAAQRAARDGELQSAIALYKDVIDASASSSQRSLALLGLADAYRLQGRNKAALETLKLVEASSVSTELRAATQVRLGGVYYTLGLYDAAELALAEAGGREKELTDHDRIALLLDLGKVAVERGRFDRAVDRFLEAALLARRAGYVELEARAALNGVRAKLDGKDLRDVEADLERIASIIASVGTSHTRRDLLIALGDVYRRAIVEFQFPQAWADLALSAFDTALDGATDLATLGYAHGLKGRLYEDLGRHGEALALTRTAIFHAQQINATEQLYRWEWQAGRILRATGRIEEAQAAYQRAVHELNEVRPNFAIGSRRTFNQLIAPVYTEYADVMLMRAATLSASDAKQQQLDSVRNVLETLKTAEVEDYFANECVARVRAQDAASIADAGAAVIYPVFLDDRTEILVEARGTLAQFTSAVGRNEITATIRRLRVNLERSSSGASYLAPAQQLYEWLIAPAEAFIASSGVGTLVLVPEGALRTIPISALHDGKQFLIERFAVATTPAIELTKQLQTAATENLLVGGLTEGVQGFAALPNVDRELATINSIYPAKTIRDATFQLRSVESELEAGGYSVAHFATHGEFSPDHKQSFILTYDDKLTLDGLQQLLNRRDQSAPLDLLVLSACKTAAGDDRAALGLAGVAVQSGAQSALASLWYISDAATAQLIETFYGELRRNRSKADSLRAAQIALLATPQYSHPSYWAPYLLVGNWL